MFNLDKLFGPADVPAQRISPNLLAPEFGDVSHRQVGDRRQVVVTLAMGAFVLGDGEQRCITGLALDASQSMQDHYGRGQTVPSNVAKIYLAKGQYAETVRDGVVRKTLTKEARDEIVKLGLAIPTANIVEAPSKNLIENMIRTFATGGVTSGKCEVTYWACGAAGRDIESLGDFRQDQLEAAKIVGPRSKPFGPHTFLVPAFRDFAQKSLGLAGVFVFVTDGHIEDEQEVIAETHRVAAEMKAGQRLSIKCVLIGIGKQVDRAQLGNINDMDMPAGLEDVDMWNAQVFADMRDLNDAWSEIFDPDTVVGTSLRVFDDRGQLVHEQTDEVKALITFEMPAASSSFELVLDGEMKVRQQFV